MDSQSLAYLDAMGIDVWQPRQETPESVRDSNEPRIVIGAGDGDILCIVHSETQARLKLASGIGGAMRCQPMWGWPSGGQENAGDALTIQDAVTEKLLTRVLVFGNELAAELFATKMPEVISTARIHLVPGLDELAQDQEAKRSLWRLMNENGIAASRSGGR